MIAHDRRARWGKPRQAYINRTDSEEAFRAAGLAAAHRIEAMLDSA